MKIKKIVTDFITNIPNVIVGCGWQLIHNEDGPARWAYLYHDKTQENEPVMALIIQENCCVRIFSYVGASESTILSIGDPEFFDKLEEYIKKVCKRIKLGVRSSYYGQKRS